MTKHRLLGPYCEEIRYIKDI